MSNDKIRPSKRWYWISLAIAIPTCITCVIVLVTSVIGALTGIQQVVVPGVHNLELSKPGSYLIYHEYQSVIGGKVFSTKQIPVSELRYSIHSLDGTEQIEVSPCPPTSEYNLGGRRKGISIYKFKIAHPGMYVLSAKYIGEETTPEIVLGIARRLKEMILPIMLFSMFASVIILISTCIFWITFFKRLKARKKLVQNKTICK